MSARDDLEAAIRAAAIEADCIDDEYPIITEWVLVGRAVGAADNESRYFRLYSGGSLPPHTAVGLMTYAIDHELHGVDE